MLHAHFDFNERFASREIDDERACDVRKLFVCAEESAGYCGALQEILFKRLKDKSLRPDIVEFGSGTGSPVIDALLSSGFSGKVHGFERNREATERANQLIKRFGVGKNYVVHNRCFFEGAAVLGADYLVANPPYIPCEDRGALILPDLYGGFEGHDVSKCLLSCGYKNLLLEVSSYAYPMGLVQHARWLGYRIVDFQIRQLPFGIYSRQYIVQKRIHEMKEAGKASFSEDCYLVGSALFSNAVDGEIDLSDEFLRCLTSLG